MLCDDDFGNKYIGKYHATHLLNTLKEHYDISIDWKGDQYCGLTIAWNYAKNYVEILMLGYIKKYLQWLKYLVVQKVEDLAVSFSKPDFGAKLQQADNASTQEILKPSDIKPIQLVVVTLFYYALAVDNTMIVVLGDLVSTQTKVQLQNWRH